MKTHFYGKKMRVSQETFSKSCGKIVQCQILWKFKQPIYHMEGAFIFVSMFDFDHE